MSALSRAFAELRNIRITHHFSLSRLASL